jgi:hypothetical protein
MNDTEIKLGDIYITDTIVDQDGNNTEWKVTKVTPDTITLTDAHGEQVETVIIFFERYYTKKEA